MRDMPHTVQWNSCHKTSQEKTEKRLGTLHTAAMWQRVAFSKIGKLSSSKGSDPTRNGCNSYDNYDLRVWIAKFKGFVHSFKFSCPCQFRHVQLARAMSCTHRLSHNREEGHWHRFINFIIFAQFEKKKQNVRKPNYARIEGLGQIFTEQAHLNSFRINH